MKKIIVAISLALSGLLLMGATDNGLPNMPFDCSGPFRDTLVCRTMRHLRSHVHMLGEQRDHMQVNYSFLKNMGDDIQSLVAHLMVQRRAEGHLEDLNNVKEMAISLSEAAMNEQVEALMYANNIQSTCQQCHNSASPSSGYRWDEIYKVNWTMILNECNTPSNSRNPYICRSMFGMLSAVDYFYSANQLQSYKYATIVDVATELRRLAMDLKAKNMTHGEDPQGLFNEIIERSEKIISLAELEDRQVAVQMGQVTDTCFSCHSVDNDDSRSASAVSYNTF